ncbi:hypothetical protein Q1695_009468 [Nippostrongylus brasiliensis]|nr:hypothetical protein Q1695_009468 [Nippostrongylus brasiliensis]
MFPGVGQLALTVIGGISMALYSYLIFKLLREKSHQFKSSYYLLFLLQAAADFFVFLSIELIQKPRKFNYFDLYSEEKHSFAVFSYINLIMCRSFICCGHVVIALNRLTAFIMPLKYETVWRRSTAVIAVAGLWLVTTIYKLPIVFVHEKFIQFQWQSDGVLQLLPGNVSRICVIATAVENILTVLLCSVFYVTALTKARGAYRKQEAQAVECRLLVCAVATSLPFIVELLRSITVVVWAPNSDSEVFIVATEFWFYEVEVIVMLSFWLQVCINGSARSLVLRGLLRRKSRKHVVANTSSQPHLKSISSSQ